MTLHSPAFFFCLFLSGGCGTLLRYGVSVLARHWTSSYMATGAAAAQPLLAASLGTLLVNAIGSLLAGVLLGASLQAVQSINELAPMVRHFLMVGFLGGFTTFSAFSLNTLQLYQQMGLLWALANVVLNVLLGLLLVYVDFKLWG